MIAAIQDNVVTPVAVVAQHASHKGKPIRVLTNANLGEREQLLDLGISVQAMDTASVNALSGNALMLILLSFFGARPLPLPLLDMLRTVYTW